MTSLFMTMLGKEQLWGARTEVYHLLKFFVWGEEEGSFGSMDLGVKILGIQGCVGKEP